MAVDTIARGMAGGAQVAADQALQAATDTRIFKNGGTYAFADVPAASKSTLNFFYTITDAFTTTDDFVEGAGIEVAAMSEIAVVKQGTSYKYNLYGSLVDGSKWGDITGNLGDQTDLANALAGKEASGTAAAAVGAHDADEDAHSSLFQQKVNLPSQVTVTDAAPVIASLADNADYVFSTALTGLTVTAIAVEGVTTLRFTVGAANLTPSFPASLVFTGNSPTFKAGKTYICAVTPLGSGHIMAWSEAVSAS